MQQELKKQLPEDRKQEIYEECQKELKQESTNEKKIKHRQVIDNKAQQEPKHEYISLYKQKLSDLIKSIQCALKNDIINNLNSDSISIVTNLISDYLTNQLKPIIDKYTKYEPSEINCLNGLCEIWSINNIECSRNKRIYLINLLTNPVEVDINMCTDQLKKIIEQ